MDQGIPEELRSAAEPVLRDPAAAGLRPRLTPEDWGEPFPLAALSWWPDGTLSGVWVGADESPQGRIARLADQLSDAAVETLPRLGRPAVWPECPDHPDRHPLQARCLDAVAVWVCPRNGRVVARIGELPPPLPRS